MVSKFLYFGFEPLYTSAEKKKINDCFREELAQADWVEISVGYCGHNSLKELEKLVDEGHIKHICLTLGMYFNDGGFSLPTYKLIMKINEKWVKRGIGEIRLVHDGRNHEKLYCFGKDNEVFSAIIGSSNLIFLVPPSSERPTQREVGQLVTDLTMLKNYKEHLEWLKSPEISANVAELEEYKFKTYDTYTSAGEERKISKIKYTKNSQLKW